MPRAISPNTGAPESVVGEEQHEYKSLPVAHYFDSDMNSPVRLTRWTFTDMERLMIAEGEDLYVAQMTFEHAYPPVQVMVGPHYYKLENTDAS